MRWLRYGAMRLNRFEEIEAWKTARKLVNQIQGAAVSAMSNIAEGFSRQSNKEFIQLLFIAKSSAAEVQSQLYVALDQQYISRERFDGIYQQAKTVSRLISGFIK